MRLYWGRKTKISFFPTCETQLPRENQEIKLVTLNMAPSMTPTFSIKPIIVIVKVYLVIFYLFSYIFSFIYVCVYTFALTIDFDDN